MTTEEEEKDLKLAEHLAGFISQRDRIVALANWFGGYWNGEHPDLTVANWVEVVMDSGTREGYWKWVYDTLDDAGRLSTGRDSE